MRYEVLGPLRLIKGDRAITIGAKNTETVLTVLIARSGQVVAINRLVSEIWGDEPPQSATASLYVYVSQLRKLLARPGTGDGGPIVTRQPGYMLTIGPDELDSDIFGRLVREGRIHLREARPASAVDCFARALDLWRGPALAESRQSSIVDGFANFLAEARMECLELLNDARLELGQHRELIGPLYSLVGEHPLHEALYRQLMLALYRSERTADALKVYQQARETLNTELGLEPGATLQATQYAILNGRDASFSLAR